MFNPIQTSIEIIRRTSLECRVGVSPSVITPKNKPQAPRYDSMFPTPIRPGRFSVDERSTT